MLFFCNGEPWKCQKMNPYLFSNLSIPNPLLCIRTLQRVLEADENGDGFHDDDEFELDTPKRKNRNRGKVSVRQRKHTCYSCVLCKRE